MNEKEIRKHYGWNKSANPNVIVDRKKKRFTFMMDENVVDPMGVERAREAKKHEIPIDHTSLNPIHKFLTSHKPKDLLNRTVWCIKSDKSKTYKGRVVDVYPPEHLLVRCNGNNLPMTFHSVIALETEAL